MREYDRRFRVRHYELDSFGYVNNAVYVEYTQEAAIEASPRILVDLQGKPVSPPPRIISDAVSGPQ